MAVLARCHHHQAGEVHRFGRAGRVRPQGPGRQLVGPGDIEVQTRQVFENIKTLLTQAGATFQDVIELTVYLVDMNHFPICGQVAQEYVGDPPPAMNLIGVNALGFPELMVEITALAVQ